MLVSRWGFRRAQEKLIGLQQQVKMANLDTALQYHNSGDGWHDNPGWHHAENLKSLLDGQIEELRVAMNHSRLIDELEFSGRVMPGARVRMRDTRDTEIEYIVLGPLESDLSASIISYEAPLARVLIGHSPGESIRFRSETFTILSVERWDGLDGCEAVASARSLHLDSTGV